MIPPQSSHATTSNQFQSGYNLVPRTLHFITITVKFIVTMIKQLKEVKVNDKLIYNNYFLSSIAIFQDDLDEVFLVSVLKFFVKDF